MKQIKVLKRRGQNEHLKQGNEQEHLNSTTIKLTLIHKRNY